MSERYSKFRPCRSNSMSHNFAELSEKTVTIIYKKPIQVYKYFWVVQLLHHFKCLCTQKMSKHLFKSLPIMLYKILIHKFLSIHDHKPYDRLKRHFHSWPQEGRKPCAMFSGWAGKSHLSMEAGNGSGFLLKNLNRLSCLDVSLPFTSAPFGEARNLEIWKGRQKHPKL